MSTGELEMVKTRKTARNKEIFSHKFTQKTQTEYFRNINKYKETKRQ